MLMSGRDLKKEGIIETLERQLAPDNEGGILVINSPEEGQMIMGKLLPGRKLFVITPTEIILSSSTTDGVFHRIPFQKDPVWEKLGGEGF